MGRYLFAGGLAIGVVGCAQLAGIDETSGPTHDRVSLSFQRVSIGATTEVAPQDLTGYTATYLVPDAAAPGGLTRVFAQQSAADAWSADIATGTPAVEFTLPDFPRPIPRLWAIPARAVTGAFTVLEHPHPAPADPAATLTIDATLDAAYAGEGLQLYTVGTWARRGFSGTELPAAGATTWTFGPFPYASAEALTGRPLEKLTTADQPLLLRYVGNDLTGVLEVPPFDQTAADALAGAIVANPHDQMLTAMLAPAELPARYAPARPALANLTMAWSVNASPGAAWAQTTGPTLIGGGVAPGDPGTLSVPYGNPFTARGWPTTMTWSTTESRTFTPAGGTLPATLSGGLYQVVTPAPNMMLTLPAGLPEAITLDGRPLSTDGLMLAQPTVAMTATFLVPTPCTLYQLQLLDLVPNAAATALEERNVLSQTSTMPAYFIPPEALEVGHTYTLRAVCIAGSYPQLATGDLATRDLPLAVGYFDGGVFTVMP